MDGGEFFITAALDIALALEMNNHRTLLSLQGIVTTRADETFDDMVKRVVVVIEQHNVPLVVQQDVGQNVFLRQGVRATYLGHRVSGFVARR